MPSLLDSFSPGSPFGVPLVPFPPGVEWTSTQELLREAFSAVRHPWVRRYLLRPSTVDDIYGLTDTGNYERAFSLIFRAESIAHLSEGFKSNVLSVRLNIPVMRHGHVGMGMGVESNNVLGSGDVIFSKSDRFLRYVVNNSRNSHLSIKIHGDSGTIEATYMVYVGHLWQYALLVFNHDAVLEAFNVDIDNYTCLGASNEIDVEKINSSLIQSIIGGVHHDSRPNLVDKNKGYPYAIADNVGEHFFKNVFCSYAGGQPMMSIPVFGHGTWSYDYDAAALRRMQNWGITERLQRLTIQPPHQQPMSMLYPEKLSTSDVNTISEPVQDTDASVATDNSTQWDKVESAVHLDIDLNSGLEEIDNIIDCTSSVTALPLEQGANYFPAPQPEPTLKFVNIAPFPAPEPEYTAKDKELTKDEIRKEKAERRKIKKREAAARYNDRKAAERLRNLAKNN